MAFAIVQGTFWDHGSTEFQPVPNPAWSAIQAELRNKRSVSLAGADPDQPNSIGTLTLQRHQAGWLVTATTAATADPVWLTDAARGRFPSSLGCCGGAMVPGKYIVPDALALQAAEYFTTRGGCHPDLAWLAEPPAQ